MPHVTFNRILEVLSGRGVLENRQDALNKPSTAPLAGIVAALQVLTHGKAFDEIDDMCDIFATSARNSFHAFIEEIAVCYGDEYLSALDGKNLKRILSINAARVFPGCVGS